MNKFRAIGVAVFMCFAGSVAAQADDGGALEVRRLIHQGKFDDAAHHLEDEMIKNANNPQLRFLQGVIQIELKNLDLAISLFQKMTIDFPHFAEPYNNLAVLYAKKGQLDKARAALELAILNMPTYSTAYENLGDVYAKLADENYKKAALHDATNVAVLKKLKTPAVAQNVAR